MTAGREEALAGIYSDDFAIPRDDAQTALDNLEAYNQEQAQFLKMKLPSNLKIHHCSSSLSDFYLCRNWACGNSCESITQPLSQTVHMIREMGMGLRKQTKYVKKG